MGLGSFLPIVCCRDVVVFTVRVCLSLSYTFRSGVFLIYLMCRNRSIRFFFSSEGIVLCVALDAVCPWGEVRSGSSYITIWDWKPVRLILIPMFLT